MPKRVSADEAARMGLVEAPARKKIPAAQAAAMGLVEKAPSRKEQLVDALKRTVPGLSSEQQKDLADIAGRGRSAVMGLTSNMGDRVESFVDAATQNPEEQGGWVFDNSDKIHGKYMDAVAKHPGSNILGAIAQPNPLGKLSAATKLGKVGVAAARVGQAGANDALSRYMGQTGPQKQDALDGVGVPMALQAGAEVLSPALGKLGARYIGRAGEVRAAKGAKDLEEMTASRTGRYNQKVQDAERTTENLERKLRDPNVDEEIKTQIRFFLDSDEGRAQTNQIAANSLERAPGKFDEMASLKALRDSAPQDAAKETADYFSKSTLRHDVLPRAQNYAARMIPQGVASAVGDMAGGAKGVAAGVAGALSGAALGRPGTSIANLLQKTPRFSAKLFDTLGDAAGVGQRINNSPAAAAPVANALEDYLKPKDDEQRQEEGAAWFTSATGRAGRR